MTTRSKFIKQFPFPEAKSSIGVLKIALVFLLVTLAQTVLAQDLSSPKQGTVITPQSSIERPEDVGVRAHTNYELFLPAGMSPLQNQPGPPPGVETPASLACIYQLVPGPYPAGCKISSTSTLPTGGSGVIAIVDAYDYPHALSDLQVFSTFYGLPAPKFYKLYGNGTSTPPPTDSSGGWEGEEALDIEWAHAMAPNATIVLVEAQSSLLTDLMAAEAVATDIFAGGLRFCIIGQVCLIGPGEISNSWGASEFSGETSYDTYFEPPPIHCYDQFLCTGGFDGLTIFASTGDHLRVSWPSVSPWVVSAGGTTINRDINGKFVRESTWYDPGCPPQNQPPCGGGGGPSNGIEAIPTYQASLNSLLNGWRGTPDISFEANPNSGVGVYDTNYPYSGWIPGYIGGTSLSSPALAGIVNSAGNFYGYGSVGQGYIPENSLLYSELGGVTTYQAYFTDIRHINPDTYQCGTSGQYVLLSGWDFCTGVGTPLTLIGK